MGWFSRFTRFADMHMVYGQEAVNSCGIASVMMVVFKINKLVPGAQALYKEKEVYAAYDKHLAGSDVDTGSYDGSVYTYAGLLAKTLNDLKVGSWEAKFVGAAAVPQAIMDAVGVDYVGAGPIFNGIRRKDPIIVLVNWAGNMGGHFVVVDTVNKIMNNTWASVCDPWDADVHITPMTKGAPFNYTGKTQWSSWSLGGVKQEYTTESNGAVQGWVVRRVA